MFSGTLLQIQTNSKTSYTSKSDLLNHSAKGIMSFLQLSTLEHIIYYSTNQTSYLKHILSTYLLDYNTIHSNIITFFNRLI
jgi:hypothetical protein